MLSHKSTCEKNGGKVELIQYFSDCHFIIFQNFQVVVQITVVFPSDFQENVGDADAMLIEEILLRSLVSQFGLIDLGKDLPKLISPGAIKPLFRIIDALGLLTTGKTANDQDLCFGRNER